MSIKVLSTGLDILKHSRGIRGDDDDDDDDAVPCSFRRLSYRRRCWSEAVSHFAPVSKVRLLQAVRCTWRRGG